MSSSSSSVGVQFQRILVAVDGSANSRKAARTAVSLAEEYGASLFVLQVLTNSSEVNANSNGGSTTLLPQKMESAEVVQEVVSLAEKMGVKVRGEHMENVPSVPGAIIEYADGWKIDLIVVGTRGLTSFRLQIPRAPMTLISLRKHTRGGDSRGISPQAHGRGRSQASTCQNRWMELLRKAVRSRD